MKDLITMMMMVMMMMSVTMSLMMMSVTMMILSRRPLEEDVIRAIKDQI